MCEKAANNGASEAQSGLPEARITKFVWGETSTTILRRLTCSSSYTYEESPPFNRSHEPPATRLSNEGSSAKKDSPPGGEDESLVSAGAQRLD